MKKQLISATAAACVSLAGLSLPASAELPITLNAGAGYWYFDRDDVAGFEPDDQSTPWASLEWAFNDNWAAEILYAYDSWFACRKCADLAYSSQHEGPIAFYFLCVHFQPRSKTCFFT